MRATREISPDSLADKIAQFQAGLLPGIPADAMQAMTQAGQEIVALGMEQNAPKTGDCCPKFALSNARGRTVPSRQLLASCGLVICF